jgi:hypothetical protein
MKLRQSVIVGSAMTGIIVLGAGPALAAYPPTTGTGTVNRSWVKQGQTVAFCGGGYAPKSMVSISVGGRYYQSVRSNKKGRFCAAVRPWAIGRHTLAGNGVGENAEQRTLVALLKVREKQKRDRAAAAENADRGGELTDIDLVSATSGGGPSDAPLTAAETAALVSTSLLLLGAGTGFQVAAGRRRRQPVN